MNQEQKQREQLRNCCSSLACHHGREDSEQGMIWQYLWELEPMGLDRLREGVRETSTEASDMSIWVDGGALD